MRSQISLKSFIFTQHMTMAIIITFLPLLLDSRGYTKTEIGLIYSLGPTIGIISNLIWGIASDRFRTIKWMLMIILSGQLTALLLLLKFDLYAIVIIIMCGFFFFQAPTNPLSDSLTMLTVRKYGQSYASYRVFGSLGFAFAATVFGIVLNGKAPEVTIWLGVGTIILSLLVALTLQDQQGGFKKMVFSDLFKLIRSRALLTFFFLVLLLSIGHRMNDNFLAIYMRGIGASDTLVGATFTTAALCEIPVFWYLARHGHRFKDLPLLIIASIVYASRFLLYALIASPWVIVAAQSLHSLSYGVFWFTSIRYLEQLIPDEYRSSGQSLYAVVWMGLSGMLSGTIGGQLFDRFGGQSVYFIASSLAFVAAIGFLWLHFFQKNEAIPLQKGQG